MKKGFLIITIVIFQALVRLSAQVYPYWDDGQPTIDAAAVGGSFSAPYLATTNALFAIHNGFVARWTKCGGWEDIGGLMINSANISGLSWGTKMMTIHGHYLYAVGYFNVVGYTNAVNYSDILPDISQYNGISNCVQIAKLDLNTGTWYPLGQNFTVTDVMIPTTIAIDANNRIYVGFGIGSTNDIPDFNGQTVNILNVSTNDGASWQTVGSGFVASSAPYGSFVSHVSVTALCAQGTNIYIGGDFYGTADGLVSPHIIMWSGNAWLPFTNGVALDTYVDGEPVADPWACGDLFHEPGTENIEDIACIGTNLYVTGLFVHPQTGIARFSNVTGALLPVADTPFSIDSAACGMSLVVNNENLYVGLNDEIAVNSGFNSIACLSDPTAASPANWSSLAGGVDNEWGWPGSVLYLAAATNGNAVYVVGQYTNNNIGFAGSFVVSRWLVGPDDSSTTAIITNINWQSNSCTFTVIGTPSSHWQILSSPDKTNWSNVGAITLWSGTNVFTDNGSSGQPYYKLANNCTESAVYASAKVVNVQFALPGDPQQVGFAGTGIFINDYWNIVPGETNFDTPIYLTEYWNEAVTEIDSLSDGNGNSSGIGLAVMAGSPFSEDPPVNIDFGSDVNPLLNEGLLTGGSDFQLLLNLPNGHTYDVYLYSVTSPGRYASTFTLTSYSGIYHSSMSLSNWSPETTSTSNYAMDTFVEGNQYIVFRGLAGGQWIIQISNGIPLMNGFQIRVH